MAISQEYWNELGKNSILLNAVSNWRDDPELWFSKSVNRLSETVRVNYLRKEWKWVEEWLLNIGAKKIEWFRDTQGSAWTLPFERARNNSSEQGPLIPLEALVTVENDEWIWKKVDRKVLKNLGHRLVLQNSNGYRREILMTSNMDNAMDAASIIVDLDGGCVLIETLEP